MLTKAKQTTFTFVKVCNIQLMKKRNQLQNNEYGKLPGKANKTEILLEVNRPVSSILLISTNPSPTRVCRDPVG